MLFNIKVDSCGNKAISFGKKTILIKIIYKTFSFCKICPCPGGGHGPDNLTQVLLWVNHAAAAGNRNP